MAGNKKDPCSGLKGKNLTACQTAVKKERKKQAPIKKARVKGEKIGREIGHFVGGGGGFAAGAKSGKSSKMVGGALLGSSAFSRVGEKLGGAIAERRAKRIAKGPQGYSEWVLGERLTKKGRERGKERRRIKKENEAYYQAKLKKRKKGK